MIVDFETPVEKLLDDHPAATLLESVGIRRLGQLITCSEKEIIEIKGIGKKSLEYIKETLHERGKFSLGMVPSDFTNARWSDGGISKDPHSQQTVKKVQEIVQEMTSKKDITKEFTKPYVESNKFSDFKSLSFEQAYMELVPLVSQALAYVEFEHTDMAESVLKEAIEVIDRKNGKSID